LERLQKRGANSASSLLENAYDKSGSTAPSIAIAGRRGIADVGHCSDEQIGTGKVLKQIQFRTGILEENMARFVSAD